MKKIKLFGMIVFALFLGACAGNNSTPSPTTPPPSEPAQQVLTCSQSQNDEGMATNSTIITNFNAEGDHINKMRLEMSFSAESDEAKQYWAEIVPYFEAGFVQQEIAGVSFDSNNDAENFKYSVSADIDPERLDGSTTLAEFAGVENITTIDQLRQDLQSQGYTC